MTASQWMHLDAPATGVAAPPLPLHPGVRQALVTLAGIIGLGVVLAVVSFVVIVIVISGLSAGAAGGCGGG